MAIFKKDPSRPTYKGGYGMDFFKPLPNNAIKWGLAKIEKIASGPVKKIKK